MTSFSRVLLHLLVALSALVAFSQQCLVASTVYTEDVIWTENRLQSQVRLQLAISNSDNGSYLWEYTLSNLSFVGDDYNANSIFDMGDIGVFIVKTAFDQDYFERHGDEGMPMGLETPGWQYLSEGDNLCDVCPLDVSERAWVILGLQGGLTTGESATFRFLTPTAHRARGLVNAGAYEESPIGAMPRFIFGGSFAVPAPPPEIPEPSSLVLLASGLALIASKALRNT